MFSKKVMGKVNDMTTESVKELGKQLKQLEDHMITVQENQVQFEKYLKDILNRVKQIEKTQTTEKKE